MRRDYRFIRIVTLACLLHCIVWPAEPGREAAQVDSLLHRYHEYGRFNGTVLVADKGAVIYKNGFGLANMEWEIPNAPDTKFRLGSVTKQFTATLILQLVAEKKIDLQSSMGVYLPEYPAAVADKVTIHHLLTHSSGIVNYTAMGDFWKERTRDPYEPLDFIKVFSDKELEFEPGSRYKYSNSGYFLLGVIVEKVAGTSYEEALQARVFGPLGMQDSGYDRHRKLLAKRARGYHSTLDGYVNAPYLDMSVPYAAGALYSTVEDLYRWDRALYTDKVLSAKYRELMFTGYISHPTQALEYGYGWFIEKPATRRTEASTSGSKGRTGQRAVIGHGGGINGFSTLTQRIPEDKRLVVLLNNTGGAPLGEISEAIRAVLDGASPKMPKKPVSLTLYETYQEAGVEAVVRRFKTLNEEEAESYDFSSGELDRLGRHLLQAKKTEDAVRVFQLSVETHPKQGQAYLGLAEAYREAGKKKQAVQNYAKALELNPESAESILDQLKKLTEQ